MLIRSIGAKLTVWYTSLLTVTFLFLGGVAYGLLAYSLARDMDTALNGVAGVMARKARLEGAPIFPSEVDETFRRFFGFSPFEHYIDIFNPRGQRDPRHSPFQSKALSLSPQALKNAAQGLPTYETIPVVGTYPVRVLTKPVISAGRVSNVVQVGMSLENIIQTRRRFLLIIASMLPFGLLLSGGGGWLLARRALRPVDQMTRTAQRISGERLDERIQESGNDDELDRLAKTLNDMLGRLDSAFHQMRKFSADASHELKTPLTILRGEMEVALRAQRSPEEYQRVLESGLEEIDRINHLVEGLLLLARVDAGMLQMERQPVALEKLLQEIGEQMNVVATSHFVDLQCGEFESVSLLGDREHLRRLFLNLVDNAIKYTETGGSVMLKLQSDSHWASVRITDTGVGLSPEDRRQIFNRFHRSTETRAKDAKGVGLGLSIAQSIAEAHGGRIEVASTPGKGSTFKVVMPINPNN